MLRLPITTRVEIVPVETQHAVSLVDNNNVEIVDMETQHAVSLHRLENIRLQGQQGFKFFPELRHVFRFYI